jgi:hypothetical protein
MKTISVLVIMGISGLLVITNPKLNNFEEFVNQHVKEEIHAKQDPMASILGSLFGGLASRVIAQQTVRCDFVFFSTYDIAIGKEHLRAIGLLNNFFITEQAAFK